MSTLRTIFLLLATTTTGLAAGVFVLYAHTVMPGLKSTDDRTFVAAFQALDRAIINPWFMVGGFGGALVFTAAAAAVTTGRAPFAWVLAALVAYLVVVVITVVVNVPLNDAIKAAGSADPAGAREAFGEDRWAAWNLARAVLSTGAFLSLAWALVIYDRT